ncbi:MAG: MBL fold metallo-hydrolase [Verrucomicrobiota bacterium]
MLQFAVLGSGSSGNSAVVCEGDTKILIDAGLSARQLCVRLEALEIEADSLTGIVLTHEHGDHTRGIDVFCRKRPLSIYGTVHTCALVREEVTSPVSWYPFEAGTSFSIGSLSVESFSVPHDAVDPVGFVIENGNNRLGILSDVGHITRMIIERLRGVNTLFVEANYDEVMLQNDTKRPWSTKQRISNRHGHLSNDQTAELIAQIASPALSRVVLGHLSSDCNSPELAKDVIARKLSACGFDEVQIECAERKKPLSLKPTCHSHDSSSLPAAVSETSEEKPAKSRQVCHPTSAPRPSSTQNEEWSQTEWAF